ncbi:MAG: hypothetical protein VW124_17485 [Paracoccaceae bacterium]
MKILFVNIAVTLYAPHRAAILDEFKSRKECVSVFECLNFTPLSLKDSLNAEIEKQQPDFIAVDPWVLLEGRRDQAFLKHNLVEEKHFVEKCEAVLSALSEHHDAAKLIFGGWLDVHSLTYNETNTLIDWIENHKTYLWGLCEGDYFSFDDYPKPNQLRIQTNHYKDLICTDHNLSKRIVPYLHSVPEALFVNTSYDQITNQYEFDFHVPGSSSQMSYPSRHEMIQRHSRLFKPNQTMLMTLCNSINSSFTANPNKSAIAMSNYLYFDLIKKSKLCFVDGGRMEYVVTKYLEVPALGSLLISPKLHSMRRYGLLAGEHFYDVEEVDLEDLENLTIIERKKIFEQSRKLIWDKHCTSKRINQLMLMLNKIANGQNIKANYSNGDLFIDDIVVEA